MPPIVVPRFPPPPQPLAEKNQYYLVEPGMTNTGFGISPETKKRLENLLVETTEKFVRSKIEPKQKEPREKIIIPLVGSEDSPYLANEIVAANLANRKNLITIGLILAGVLVIFLVTRNK